MYQPMPPPAMPYYPYAYPPPPSHPYHDYQQPIRQVESAVDHRIHEIPDESNKPRRSIQRRPPLKKSTTPATLPDVMGLLRFTMKLFYFKIIVLLRRLLFKKRNNPSKVVQPVIRRQPQERVRQAHNQFRPLASRPRDSSASRIPRYR